MKKCVLVHVHSYECAGVCCDDERRMVIVIKGYSY